MQEILELKNQAYSVMYEFNKDKMMLFFNQKANLILFRYFLNILQKFMKNMIEETPVDKKTILEIK